MMSSKCIRLLKRGRELLMNFRWNRKVMIRPMVWLRKLLKNTKMSTFPHLEIIRSFSKRNSMTLTNLPQSKRNPQDNLAFNPPNNIPSSAILAKAHLSGQSTHNFWAKTTKRSRICIWESAGRWKRKNNSNRTNNNSRHINVRMQVVRFWWRTMKARRWTKRKRDRLKGTRRESCWKMSRWAVRIKWGISGNFYYYCRYLAKHAKGLYIEFIRGQNSSKRSQNWKL